MINFFKTIDNKMTHLEQLEDGCWISVVSPDQQEIDYLIHQLHIDAGFIQSALDEEESSHIENEDDQTLVIVDIPIYNEDEKDTILYSTMPMGIVLTPQHILTISLTPNNIISDIENGMVRNLQTHLRTRFLLHLLLKIATKYLQYLKQIDRTSSQMEKQLHKSMKNKELIQLLGLEKSLVYFSTSLKSNEVTLEKILRGRFIKLYEEDQDILEDVLIEVKQAIEMSNIYSSILSGTMDAFASVISNNLNIVMKALTSVTIVMAIPTIVSSFYGMNVEGLPVPVFWFPIVLSVVAMAVTGLILWKKKLF